MNKRMSRTQGGFTLVELLLVLVILAALGAVIIPQLTRQAGGAQVRAASTQISRLAMSVDTFYLDTGRTPESLDALVNEPPGVSGWNGPYVKQSLLKDPWGREYVFRNPGEHGDFDIYSYGADGQAGGEGKNADITSWE